MMTYMVVFYTHSAALQFKKNCDRQGITCELLPVPRKLSSSCGIGVRVQAKHIPETLITDELDRIFTVKGSAYTLVYASEE